MSKGLLHHIEIYVSDLKKSAEFWGWLLEELGYSSYQKWEYGQSWKIEDTYIVFVQTDEGFLDVKYHRKRVGLNHLAFHAESRQHIDDMTEKLNNRGVTILYQDQHPFAGGDNYYAVYFEAPDRIKVELVAP
ncbi:VOC family protein [Virgibacillus halodenitrificans]|uniref:VOC family protein n=1 Tax=Virgibacillus halodenitrificans TaxID=1482 RepID=UPI0024C0D49E|nr:VOC family protein [Virgibacillus halodenitrificans]WHX28092.1 VOC family protein [Virgibacillus halodenitrificans]